MPNRKRAFSIALFATGVILLNFPFISLPEHIVAKDAFPLLLVYLMIVWLGLIIGVFWLNRPRKEPAKTDTID